MRNSLVPAHFASVVYIVVVERDRDGAVDDLVAAYLDVDQSLSLDARPSCELKKQ